MKYRDGLRVRLKRSVKWCAGTPPAGSTGTVRPHPTFPGTFHVVFDRVQPKGKFVFGLLDVGTDDFLEVIRGQEKAR